MELNILEIAEKPEWKEILVDVVKKQNLDPWNIDLLVVSQDYIDRIKDLKRLNLRVSANVVLAASILLRYKSESWTLTEEEVMESPIEIPDGIYSEPVVPQLESVMRTTARKVTLEELIFAIEDIMGKEKKKAERQKRVLERIVPDSLLEMAVNGEDFEKRLQKALDRIRNSVDGENLVLFSDLLEKRTPDDVIENLISVLFLANEKKIAVWQDKAFGEIFINLIDTEVKLFKDENHGAKRAKKAD